jgi:hypothetical protein
MRENAALFDHLVERQNEVARDAEDFPGAVVFQALQERVCELGHFSNVPEFMPPVRMLPQRSDNASLTPMAANPPANARRIQVITCGRAMT